MKRVLAVLNMSAVLTACAPAVETTEDGGVRTEARRGPVEVSVTATPGTASTGERITVRIEATVQPDVTITTPMATADDQGMLGTFNVLAGDVAPDLPLEDGGRRYVQTLVLDSFEPGEHEIPGLSIAFLDARAETTLDGVIDTDPVPIDISSLLPTQAAELRDIQPWRALPSAPVWPWIVGGVALTGILVALVVTLCRRARPAGPPPTPAQVARADLAALSQAGHLERRELEPFYTRLSGIVRTYIEGRFALRAPRATTAEFLIDAGRDDRLTPSQRAHLEAFLRAADLVKFARHEPPVEQGHTALEEARLFVDQTDEVPDDSMPEAEVQPC